MEVVSQGNIKIAESSHLTLRRIYARDFFRSSNLSSFGYISLPPLADSDCAGRNYDSNPWLLERGQIDIKGLTTCRNGANIVTNKGGEKMPELIATITDDAYKKSYKMRRVGRDRSTLEVSIPASVVEREASNASLPLEEFLEQYRAEWLFDNFGGAFVRFVLAKE